MVERPGECFAVATEQAVKDALAPVVDSAVSGALFSLQNAGAHHGRGGERDDHGDEDGGRERDGELAEEAADDAAHKQQWDEHGDERDGDGEDGEADLLGSEQRGLHGCFAFFDVPGDVFHHDDRVVDDES